MSRRSLVVVAGIILTLSIVVSVLDVYVYENEGLGSLSLVLLGFLVFVTPVVYILMSVYGASKLTYLFSSKKVARKEKQEMLRRILVVITVAVIGLACWGLLSAIGTALIDI